MNKEFLKTIKFIIIAFIITTLIFSFVVSQDTHHLESCHEEHCITCSLIHFAQIIINLSAALIICISIGFLIYFILSKLLKVQTIFVQKSLVFKKVQLNE